MHTTTEQCIFGMAIISCFSFFRCPGLCWLSIWRKNSQLNKLLFWQPHQVSKLTAPVYTLQIPMGTRFYSLWPRDQYQPSVVPMQLYSWFLVYNFEKLGQVHKLCDFGSICRNIKHQYPQITITPTYQDVGNSSLVPRPSHIFNVTRSESTRTEYY